MKTFSEHRAALNVALAALVTAMALAKDEAEVARQRAQYGNLRHRQYVRHHGAGDTPEA